MMGIIDVLNYILVGVVSFLVGVAVDLGYRKWRGHKVVIPFIENTSRNITIAAIALALISVGTVINVAHSQGEVERCNAEFREALKYNTDLTAQQRTLDEHEDALDGKVRENLNQVLRAVASAPSRAVAFEAISQYNRDAQEIDAEFEKVDRERVALNRDRKPYPEPRCGQR